jgi:hypothetical protein
MTKEQHEDMIKVVKELKIKPIEVMIYDGPDGKYVLPMNVSLSPMKIDMTAKEKQ